MTLSSGESEAAFEDSDELLTLNRRTGLILSASPLLERVLGIPEGALAGRSLEDLGEHTWRAEALAEFTKNAAHDLVGPLNQASMLAALLIKRYKGQPDDVAREILMHLRNSSQRMTELVQGIGRYLQVIGARQILRQTDATAALTAALFQLQGAIERARATVTADPLPEVHADATGLITIFENLVDNAVKFRKSAEPPVIRISARRCNANWIFSIADNGIGIPQNRVENLFHPFSRLHGHEYPGSGMGLAIAKALVTAHEGRIWIESEPGCGSIVHFTLAARA